MTDKLTAPDLAALSEAATQSEPAWNVFAQALVREYRAGNLVQINEGMRERVIQAAADFLAEIDPATRVDALTVKQGYDFADAAIAAMKAEIERLTEREAQAKLDGVRAGIDASAVLLERDGRFEEWWDAAQFVRREAIAAEAIAKGEG